MSRFFDYKVNNIEFREAFVIAKRIISDILSLNNDYLDDNEITILNNYKKELKSINDILDDDSYDIERQISDDLLSPENVEYCFKNNKYKDNASSLGEKINKLFMRVFEIEDEVQILISKKWNKLLTPFEELENGKPFTIVGHSGCGFISLPGYVGYIDNEYNNTETISCSIFTDKDVNCFNSNLVMVFDINESNYISSAPFDTVTRKTGSSTKSVRNIKNIDNEKSIDAGFMHNYNSEKVVTKVVDPQEIINTINNRNDRTINETLLYKKNCTPKGLVLFTNGIDIPLINYIHAKDMMNVYNIDLKVINVLVNENQPIDYNHIDELLKNQIEILKNANMSDEKIILLLDEFIENVIKKSISNKELLNYIIDSINNYKSDNKKVY